jgi:hypothetical protein
MFKLSIEGTVGLLFEVVLGILDHLHVREPVVVWGLFIVGLLLISDSIIRSKFRKAGKIVGMAIVALAFSLFGVWIFGRQSVDVYSNENAEIEKQRLALEYAPVVTVLYQERQLRVFNSGRTPIGVWAVAYGNAQKKLPDAPRSIAPGFFYYFPSETLEQQMQDSLRSGQEGFTPCRVYITTADSQKHTAKCLLIGKRSNGRISIHTQMLDTVGGWID